MDEIRHSVWFNIVDWYGRLIFFISSISSSIGSSGLIVLIDWIIVSWANWDKFGKQLSQDFVFEKISINNFWFVLSWTLKHVIPIGKHIVDCPIVNSSNGTETTSNVRRLDSLDPRLYEAEIFLF